MARQNKKRSVGPNGRVPLEHAGLQINFCRNLECSNFGLPPRPKVPRGPGALGDGYRATGSPADGAISMICMLCGQAFQLKSNVAIIEEFERQRAPFASAMTAACKNRHCRNFDCADPDLYQSFGKTSIGSIRFRCKTCRKTFSVQQIATARQRMPEINELVLRLLVNKMPMRRICEAAGIEPAVLYNRVHFIYRQTQRFAVSRELNLANKQFDQLRIAVDRQDHTFNWVSSADRRNTKLSAVGSADCESGYVFGFELDHDPNFQPFDVDLHAREIGDYDLDLPFRRYARFFLPGDTGFANTSAKEGAGGRLPAMGLRIHAEYLLMGHFQFLRWLLPNVESLHFYLDQEPSIRSAFLAAYYDLILLQRADAFFVRIAKEMTVEEKKLIIARSETYLAKLKEKNPTESRYHLAREVMKHRYVKARADHASAANRWVESILPHMGEPLKEVCYLTDRGDADPQAVATGMLAASLHPIDRFFMQLRRRISLLERPISSASSSFRTWHGYSPYNPEIAQAIMSSFRVVYNYCLVGADKKTPAMRLELADRPVSYEEILTFV